jgi:uroporphyrinogen decarboxylase
MISRDVMMALLNKEIPERMGVYEHWWPETLNQYWISQGYPARANPEEFFNYDITSCGGWFNSEPFMNVTETVEDSDQWRLIRDGRGALLKYWKHKSGTPEHVDFEVKTREAWAKYREPLLAYDPNRLGDFEAARATLASARERGKFSVFGNMLFFELLRATLGDMTFLPALLEEPEWLHDFCQVYLDFYIRHYEVLFRECGVPDGFFIYEDLGYTNGLFCSPDLLREMIFPYFNKFVGYLKDYGMKVILHSCGDIRKAVPLMIEAGIDCLQPMEAKAGCNVVEFAETYGNKLCYMGNIDVTVLGTNDRAKVEAEVAGKVKRLKEMRIPYVFHSDHSIPPNVSFATYMHALSVFKENWRYSN